MNGDTTGFYVWCFHRTGAVSSSALNRVFVRCSPAAPGAIGPAISSTLSVRCTARNAAAWRRTGAAAPAAASGSAISSRTAYRTSICMLPISGATAPGAAADSGNDNGQAGAPATSLRPPTVSG